MSKSSFNLNAPVFVPGRPFVLPSQTSENASSPSPHQPPQELPRPSQVSPASQSQMNQLCSGMEAATLKETSWEDEACGVGREAIHDEQGLTGRAGCVCRCVCSADEVPAPLPAQEVSGPSEEQACVEAAELDERVPKEEGATASAVSGKATKAEPDPRPHLNIVFIGHVDAGKSTTCGNILYLTGGVDARTIEKYEREAKEKNRESWFLAFVMDTNEEERQKGKTVEVGRAYFSTPNRRFTLLDAPGHKAFVPNMIEGAAQADVGVLIISARKGEFETGFEKGGQTREHTLLAKTLGVCQLVVAVNKMDESTCQWSEERYREILRKTKTFFQNCGFVQGKNLCYVPISGLAGQNLKCHVSVPGSPCFDARASWYTPDQPTLFQVLDSLAPPPRKANAPLRVPILDAYKDNGVTALGKVEAGTVTFGMSAVLMPNKKRVKISGVYIDEDEVGYATVGENIRIKLLGCEEDALSSGTILCCPEQLCPVATKILAYVKVMELLEHRPLLTAGYTCVMHVHTAREEVMLGKILESSDGKKKKSNPLFVKSDCLVSIEIMLTRPMCMEEYEACSQLGRFTLRDEGKTIAAGRVTKILEFA